MARFQNQATLFSNNAVTLSNIVYGDLNDAYSINKTALKSNYVLNDSITYVVTIINNGAAALTGLTLTDNLGAYTFGAANLVPLDYVANTLLYYVNGVLQATPTIMAGPPLTVTGIDVPVNSNATIIYEAKTNMYAPIGVDGSITNTATVYGPELASDLTAQATVTVSSTPILTISKFMDPTTVTDGDTLTYTFIIQNSGNAAATAAADIRVVDTFDPALNIRSVTLNGTPFTNYTYADDVFSTNAGSITVPAATITQNSTSGIWYASPGVATLVVTGTVLG